MVLQSSLILIRLVAIFLFMKSISIIPTTFISYLGNSFEPSVQLDLLVAALNVFICVLVFCYPRVILIGLALPRKEVPAETLTRSVFQSAAIAVIGFYFAMLGLQDLVYYHILIRNLGNYQLSGQLLSPQDTAGYWTAVIQIVLGVVLVAASAGISRVFNWLRRLTPAPSSSGSSD